MAVAVVITGSILKAYAGSMVQGFLAMVPRSTVVDLPDGVLTTVRWISALLALSCLADAPVMAAPQHVAEFISALAY